MSLINKYTKDVDTHKRSNLERKRSEVILRLSELDEAVKSTPPPTPTSFRNRTTTNQRTRGKLSGAQRRKLAIERAIASGTPILRKRKPNAPETSGNRIRKSPRRTSITRKRTPRRDTYKNTGNSFRVASEKYDPAFPTSNDPSRDSRFRPTSLRDSRRSRSPIHHSTNNKNTYFRKDRIEGRSSNFRPINRNHTRSRSPAHLERDRRHTSPGNYDSIRQRTIPSLFDRDCQRTSPGRSEGNRNTRYSSRSPGHRSGNIYRQRDYNTDSNSRDRDSRRYGNDFDMDAPCNLDIPTNYTNEFTERNLNINDRDSRWLDTSRSIHSYSQSDPIKTFNQVDKSRYPNMDNADRLRSRGSDYSHPLYTNSRPRKDVPGFKDVPAAPSARNLPVRRSIDSPPKTKKDLIRISIVPVDYPKVTLLKSQADDIELALISHIKPGAAGTGPQFSYLSFLQRTLVAGCKNIETTQWLKDTVPKLNIPNVGPLKILTTKELFKSGTFPKVTMFVPNPIAKKPASTLLTLIETQNVGLHTENWRILGSNEKPGGISMALLIDKESLATLEKLELKACLGLTQAKFTIIRGNREQ